MASTVAATTDGIDQSLLEIQQSIEQAESMLDTLEVKGQGDSPTAEKIRKLLDQMRAQRKVLMDSLSRVTNLGNKMTFLEEVEERQRHGEGIQFASQKVPFRAPQPPPSDDEPETSKPVERSRGRSPSPDPLDKSPDILSMMGHILGKTNEPGKSPKWKLEQLEQLEAQLSGLKSTIDEAKAHAEKELEDHKNVNSLPLKNNLVFRELDHEVQTMKIMHGTQHERLKDVVSILNNHADRLATIEENISEMRQDMKRTTMNSMSERLLEKLLETHNSRPHFVLELFELGLCLDTDKLRNQAITSLKATLMREKMSEMQRDSPQKIQDSLLQTSVSLLNKRLDEIDEAHPPAGHTHVMSEKSATSEPGDDLETNEGFVSISAAETGDAVEVSAEEKNDGTDSENATDGDGTRDSDIQSDNNEARNLAQEEKSKDDVVSQLLSAATCGIDVTSLGDDVQKMVTKLLPILATKYREKTLTPDVIAEAKEVITDTIVEECRAGDETYFDKGNNRAYLLNSMEECLQAYKNLSVHDQSVNLLADIGTSIYRSILNAKIIGAKENSPQVIS